MSGKRRRGRHWGSRAEPFRSERSRRMRGADVARVARSPPATAVGRASVRAICATAGSWAGTPSMMIAAGKDHRTRGQSQAARQGLEKPRDSLINQATPRIAIVRRSVGGAGQTQSACLRSVGEKADVRGRQHGRRLGAKSGFSLTASRTGEVGPRLCENSRGVRHLSKF